MTIAEKQADLQDEKENSILGTLSNTANKVIDFVSTAISNISNISGGGSASGAVASSSGNTSSVAQVSSSGNSSNTASSSFSGTATVSANGSARLRESATADSKQVGTVKDGTSLKLIGKNGNWYQTESGGWISGKLLKNIKSYSTGGEVFDTGLIQIDGTKNKPERILSPGQTSDFNSLTESIDRMSLIDLASIVDIMDDWSRYYKFDDSLFASIPSELMQKNNNTIGDINITITGNKIDNDTDLDELARQIGNAFTKELSKRGFTTAFNY